MSNLSSDGNPVNHLRPELRLSIEAVKGHIRAAHDHVLGAANSFVRAGLELHDAKDACKHGEWLPFVAACGLSERKAQSLMQAAAAVDSGRAPEGLSLRQTLKLIADHSRKPNPQRVAGLEAPAAPAPGADDPTVKSWIDPDEQERAEQEDPEQRVWVPLWRLRELEGCQQRLAALTDELTASHRRRRILEATVSREVVQEAERIAQEMEVMQSRIDTLTGDLGRANARIKHLLKERGG